MVRKEPTKSGPAYSYNCEKLYLEIFEYLISRITKKNLRQKCASKAQVPGKWYLHLTFFWKILLPKRRIWIKVSRIWIRCIAPK